MEEGPDHVAGTENTRAPATITLAVVNRDATTATAGTGGTLTITKAGTGKTNERSHSGSPEVATETTKADGPEKMGDQEMREPTA